MERCYRNSPCDLVSKCSCLISISLSDMLLKIFAQNKELVCTTLKRGHGSSCMATLPNDCDKRKIQYQVNKSTALGL